MPNLGWAYKRSKSLQSVTENIAALRIPNSPMRHTTQHLHDYKKESATKMMAGDPETSSPLKRLDQAV